MRTYVAIHTDCDESLPIEISSGNPAGEYIVLAIGLTSVFLQHWQLLDLRDKITAALATSPQRCGLDGCDEQVESRKCMSCNHAGCDEHMRPVFNDSYERELEGFLCDPSCPEKAEAAA